MPTDLTPAEKDDREAERLINKSPAPSRKPAGRGAPKYDNRRRRMKDTSEKREDDKDLSKRTQSSRLLYISARLSADEDEVHEPYEDPAQEGKKLVKRFYSELGSYSSDLAKSFQTFAVKHYGPVLHAKAGKPGKGKLDPSRVMKEKQEEVVSRMNKLLGILHRVSNTELRGTPADVAGKIAELWPNGKPNNWATRAGVLGAIQNSIRNLQVPASIKAVMLKDPGNVKKNTALLEDVLKEAKSGQITDEQLADKVELATLTAAYRTLLKNPDNVDASSLVRDIDKVTERVYGEMQKLMSVPVFMKSWEKAVKEFSKEQNPETIAASEYYNEVQKSLKTFFQSDDDPVFDANAFVDGLESILGGEYGDAPPVLKKVVEGYRSAATSYNVLRIKAMPQRTATFHGVDYHHYSDGPYSGYQSIDKRYFGKKHYDSIIANAKRLLKEDWLKYDWDGGAKDAPFRAALDMAIWTADDSLYQSKIDSETYNMLLARIMGNKTDLFAETLVTNDDGKSRRASAMRNPHYQNILRVASGLRETDPRAALELVRNLRSLVAQSQDEGESDKSQEHQGQQQQQQGQQQQGQQQQQQGQQEQQGQCQEQTGQQQQQGQQVSEGDMESFVEGKLDLKDLKGHVKKLVDAQSIDDFVDGLTDLDEILKKTASGRTASIVDLEPLEDMDETQVKSFLEEQKTAAQHLMSENDIEKFLEGLDGIFGKAEDAAKSVKTGSISITASSLIHLAHANPDARPTLLGILREAAKKKQKKNKRKTDKKKGKKAPPFAKKKDEKGGKGGKKPPFGGKKAPPFGGKKAPPFGKKKSSVDIEDSDTQW